MNLTGKTNRNSGEAAHHQGEEEHEEHEVPCWLQSTLAVLIVTNILAYFLVTWSTMRDLDMQIAVLRSKRSSILPEDITTTTTSTDWSAMKMKGGENGTVSNSTTVFGATAMSTMLTLGHIHQTSEVIEDEIRVLEERKHAILLGTLMEIFLDSVDLINTFVHNFWVHVIYTVMKIASIGMWTYAQADLPFQALWFVPIGVAVLISLLLLEWHTAARKVFLVLLIIASSLAWILIVTLRSEQNNFDIEQWRERSRDPRQNRSLCELHIKQLSADMTQFIAATVVMVVLGLFGLVAIWLANLCTGITFAVLYLAGDLWWISMVSSQEDIRDHLFEVPLVYALLIATVSILYLYDLHHVQGGHPHSSSFLKRVPCLKGTGKAGGKSAGKGSRRLSTGVKTKLSLRGGESRSKSSTSTASRSSKLKIKL